MNKIKLFGKRIKELRKKKGYTQEQLSERLGLFQKQIGNIETGTCFTTMNTLEKLSNVFDVEIKDLFEFNHLEQREVLLEKIRVMLTNASDEEIRRLYKIINAIIN